MDEKNIDKIDDPIERQRLYDEAAEERFQKSLTSEEKKERQKKKATKCIWGCDEKVVSVDMCATCRNKHYSKTLLCADPTFFNHEEIMELYKDVLKFMKFMDLEKGEAVTWLISEGINSFESRMKRRRRKKKK